MKDLGSCSPKIGIYVLAALILIPSLEPLALAESPTEPTLQSLASESEGKLKYMEENLNGLKEKLQTDLDESWSKLNARWGSNLVGLLFGVAFLTPAFLVTLSKLFPSIFPPNSSGIFALPNLYVPTGIGLPLFVYNLRQLISRGGELKHFNREWSPSNRELLELAQIMNQIVEAANQAMLQAKTEESESRRAFLIQEARNHALRTLADGQPNFLKPMTKLTTDLEKFTNEIKTLMFKLSEFELHIMTTRAARGEAVLRLEAPKGPFQHPPCTSILSLVGGHARSVDDQIDRWRFNNPLQGAAQ